MEIKKIVTGALEENCYVLSKDNTCLIVDPGSDSKAIKELVGTDKIIGVLVTHAHFDHIKGVDAIVRSHSVPVYIHPQEVAFLKDPSLNASVAFYDRVSIQSPALPLQPGRMNLADFEIDVLFTPGHSCGSTCFIIDNALFSGDTLFQYSIGRTDLPTGSFMEMKESLVRLSSLDDQLIVYPGHGPSTTIGMEKRMNPYLLSL